MKVLSVHAAFLSCLIIFSLAVIHVVYGQEFSPITKWGKYGDQNKSLKSPSSIAVDSEGNVYVVDTGNNRIKMFSSDGAFLMRWGKYGTANGSFIQPYGITAVTSHLDNKSGSIYVTDKGSNRIQMFSSGNGTFIAEWGKYGNANGSFKYPSSIAVDSTGNVYVADTGNNRIQMFSSNGTFITKWGKYGNANGSFNSPSSIAVDATGNVYVSDTRNNRIQMFSSNGTFITKWGKYGTVDWTLNQPNDIRSDSKGNVYVADTGNSRVVVLNLGPTNINLSNTSGGIIIKDPSLKLKTVIKDLKLPTSVAFLGPDDMLVLEHKKARVMRLIDGKLLQEPLLNLTDFKIRSCLCDIAVAKRNLTTYVFLIMDELQDNNGRLFDRLYRYELVNNSKLENPTILLNIPINDVKSYHHGGKIVVGPDNNLYVTVGDIFNFNTKAQNIQEGLDPDGSSSILRITLEGKAVEGRSIFDDLDPLNKYYAYGIRNSFGIDYDPVTGKIWITDNGPGYGDEINLVEPGFNGGWKKVMGMASLDKGFDSTELVDFNKKGVYADPQFEWFNSIGATALKFYNSAMLGENYRNNMFVGDVNTGSLYRFQLNDTRTGLSLNGSLSDKVANSVQEREQLVFARGLGLITDIETGPDGFLYIVSYSEGKIYAIIPAKL